MHDMHTPAAAPARAANATPVTCAEVEEESAAAEGADGDAARAPPPSPLSMPALAEEDAAQTVRYARARVCSYRHNVLR
jgi:hypothetical protein